MRWLPHGERRTTGGLLTRVEGKARCRGYATAGRGGSDGERRWRRGVVGEEDGDGCIPAVRRRQRGRRATGAASAGVGLRGGRGGGLTDELRGVGGSPQARACSPGSRGAAVDATETARHRHGSGGGGGHRSTRGLRRGEQGEGRPDPRRGLRDPSISGEEAAWRGRRGLRATTDGIGRVQGERRCRGTSGAMRDRGRGRCPRSRSRKQREACGETRGGSGERGEWGRRSSRVRSGGGWADWTGLVGPEASWAVAQWGGGSSISLFLLVLFSVFLYFAFL